ncbi:hypothetical protein [Micromonospora coxensis]|uniref:Uncharacterized protein n=1 Tax=Micromonospora coxensis TaxID=356852 RepID=A0A1C5I396_9ACTN|nr:hypothetical protein [Micromonospora coxensis]SCG52792.1 hypothetical protein GA0070614_2159 [Micromonospora coxensis]
MGRYGFSILTLGMELPTIAVLVTALVLAATRRDRLPARARVLLTSGTLVLLAAGLVALAWSLAFPHLIGADWMRDGGYRRISLISFAVTAVTALGFPVGLGLLLGAVFAGRGRADAPAGPWGAWTAPAVDAAPSATPAGAGTTPATTPGEVGTTPSATPGGVGTTPPATQWGGSDLPSPASDRD